MTKRTFGKVLERMAWARELVPTVMVEMPVIPGTDSFMKELLVKLDALGVDGINLLEFAYAMWNWPVFDSLGLTLRNPPQQVVFDYTYAGALAVQDSEEDCLRLMLWRTSKVWGCRCITVVGEQTSRSDEKHERALC